MPTITITADDSSPVFQYSSEWSRGTSINDGELDQYFQSTYSTTQASGATMNFTFFGTSVYIYGSKRRTHGSFEVQIDNSTYDPIIIQNSPDLFQELLFNVDKLKNTLHEIVVTNVGLGNNEGLDIDFVTWRMDIGETGEDISVQTTQDYTRSIQYQPANAWVTNPSLVGTYNGGRGHASTAPQSSVEYSFIGAAISLYGPIGPKGAPFSVQVDEQPFQNLTSIYPARFIPQSLLYHIGGLGDGLHTIKIVHDGKSLSGQVLGIDYFNMFLTPGIDARSTGRLPASILGAIAAGTIAGLIAALLLIIYYIRKKRLSKPEHVRRKDEAAFWDFLWKWKMLLVNKREFRERERLKKGKGKRQTRDVQPFDVNGNGSGSGYGMGHTTEAEMAYLIPNYGPAGAVGSGSGSGSGSGGRGKIYGARPMSESSQPLIPSSGNNALTFNHHSRYQSSMSTSSIMNQPLIFANEAGAVMFGSPASGTTLLNSSTGSGSNPQMPRNGVQRQVSTVRHTRPASASGPGPSAIQPFPLDSYAPPPSQSYSLPPPPLTSQGPSNGSRIPLSLPPGAARPVPQTGGVIIDESVVRVRQGSRVDAEEPPEYDWDIVPHHLR